MTIFSQKDPAWAGMHLGTSQWTMGDSGCTTTNVAQALLLAGYSTLTPGIVCQAFSDQGVYTDATHPLGAGLVIWPYIERAFPQFHWKGDGYNFQMGLIGQGTHWVLEHDGVQYDPLNGSTTLDPYVRRLATVTTASIDQAPIIVPVVVRGIVTAPEGLFIRTSSHVRNDNHSLLNGKPDFIPLGGFCDYDGTEVGDIVEGNNIWLHKPDGLYVWSGATNYKQP